MDISRMQHIRIAGSNAKWEKLYIIYYKTVSNNEIENVYFMVNQIFNFYLMR